MYSFRSHLFVPLDEELSQYGQAKLGDIWVRRRSNSPKRLSTLTDRITDKGIAYANNTRNDPRLADLNRKIKRYIGYDYDPLDDADGIQNNPIKDKYENLKNSLYRRKSDIDDKRYDRNVNYNSYIKKFGNLNLTGDKITLNDLKTLKSTIRENPKEWRKFKRLYRLNKATDRKMNDLSRKIKIASLKATAARDRRSALQRKIDDIRAENMRNFNSKYGIINNIGTTKASERRASMNAIRASDSGSNFDRDSYRSDVRNSLHQHMGEKAMSTLSKLGERWDRQGKFQAGAKDEKFKVPSHLVRKTDIKEFVPFIRSQGNTYKNDMHGVWLTKDQINRRQKVHNFMKSGIGNKIKGFKLSRLIK